VRSGVLQCVSESVLHGHELWNYIWVWERFLTNMLRCFGVFVFAAGVMLTALTARADMIGAASAPGPLVQLTVLSAADAATYRRIFALGDEGAWKAVDRLIDELHDPLLLGHVLAQRYLHARYRSRYDELSRWLARYADHPDASRIYSLANRRKPAARASKRVKPLARPIAYSAPNGDGPAGVAPADRRQADARFGPAQPFAFGGGGDLMAVTAAGFGRLDRGTPETLWSAGLAAWQRGDFDTAATQFQATASHPAAGPWGISAAAFWAARAQFHARRPQAVNPLLKIAAGYPRTFYGQMALRILGLPLPFDRGGTAEDKVTLSAFAHNAAGRRALALIQARQPERARRELVSLLSSGDRTIRLGAMLAADLGGIPDVAMRLESSLHRDDGRIHAAGYPVPAWAPSGGYRTDRALVFAIIRQESAFDPNAVSRVGARGLMQLMPATARYVSRRTGYRLSNTRALADPDVNLVLGQRYLDMLLGLEGVDGDLFRLAVAWNAGPGNLERWAAGPCAGNDPLLFIETIPSGETRAFIERVLANLWIYRYRLGQPAPSLDALASGTWPAYSALGDQTLEMAQYAPN
jgi:peptidoglycan lytic transglycosylase